MSNLQTRRLGYALGAEIIGLDLSRPLDQHTVDALKQTWGEHLVLLIRGQDLSHEQLVAFSCHFGPLSLNESSAYGRDPRIPEIFVVSTKPVDGRPSETRNTGRNWHSDGSHTLRPAMGSLLHCRELPEVGGNTLWTSMIAAYEALSPTLRRFLGTLSAVHDVSLLANFTAQDRRNETLKVNPAVVHPVVRTIPETGRKALYVSDRTRHFVGMTAAESQPILKFLIDHATSPEFGYRHIWQEYDLVMWDNRATMHYALADFDLNQPRHMIRTTVLGEHVGELY